MVLATQFKAGLEDVVAGTSEVCFIDGKEGRLVYCGYDVRDLAEHSTFEEVVFLLWNKRLPSQAELDDLDRQLRMQRALPPGVLQVLRATTGDVHPMAALRTAVSAIGHFDPEAEDNSREANIRKAIRLTAQMATAVCAWQRLREGKEPVAPRSDLSHAANFLYMLLGQEPDAYEARVFDVALILHADHELNASTFAARVITATEADMYSAIAGAVGALKGPLHGGANEAVMRMLLEVGTPEAAESWVRQALQEKRKISGFGHRVYKVKDPRAYILENMAREMTRRSGNTTWFDMCLRIEKVMAEEKQIYPNVDFFSGATYYSMGVPIDLFTPIFAVSRISGWTAHILEQQANNRLIRPRAEYVGPIDQSYVPIEQR